MHEDRPFDAWAICLSDSNQQMAGRRTISLVSALKGLLEGRGESRPATTDALEEIFGSVTRELTRRGMDAVALVRYGMWQQVMSGLISNLTATRLAPHWGITSFAADSDFDHERWAKVLGLPDEIPAISQQDPRKAGEEFVELLSPIVPLAISWISCASVRDLVQLLPPGEKIPPPPEEDISKFFELRSPYLWMVDYFSTTFLHDWDTSSLHLTYQWIKGAQQPPCDSSLMDDRRIDRSELAIEIADRATVEGNSDTTFRGSIPLASTTSTPQLLSHGKTAASFLMLSLVGEMTRHANQLLTEGRYREAAAVFEFGVQGAPNSADLHNNWGFCLIPENPREALNHLVHALDLGYHNSALNIYNQMCCCVALGRPQAALSLAEHIWSRSRDLPPSESTIWLKGEAGWTLSTSNDISLNIAQFALLAARNVSADSAAETWSKRVTDLNS